MIELDVGFGIEVVATVRAKALITEHPSDLGQERPVVEVFKDKLASESVMPSDVVDSAQEQRLGAISVLIDDAVGLLAKFALAVEDPHGSMWTLPLPFTKPVRVEPSTALTAAFDLAGADFAL